MNSASWLPALWLLLVVAAIPAALWLLKRSPLQGLSGQGGRVVGVTHLGPGQRVVTLEVGEAEHRCWLVLGVSNQGIHKLHELPPGTAAPAAAPRFADFLKRSTPA